MQFERFTNDGRGCPLIKTLDSGARVAFSLREKLGRPHEGNTPTRRERRRCLPLAEREGYLRFVVRNLF